MKAGHSIWSKRHSWLRAAVVGLVSVGAVLASHATVGASSVADPGVTPSTILIGQTAPQSGPAAQYGESTWGVRAYFAYVNAHGGVHGRKLNLISIDDQYQPPVALQETRKLVDQDHVFSEVAVNGSATTKADLTLLDPQNVPLVGPQTGASFLLPFQKNVYNVWPSYLTEGKMLGNFAVHTLHVPVSKIGVLYQNDDFGKSLYQGVQNAGVHPGVAISYDPTQTDFSPQAEKFKSSGTKAVIMLSIPGPTITFLNAMAAIKYKPIRIMSQVSAIPQSFSSAKKEFPGSYIGAFIPPLQETSNRQVRLFRTSMSRYQHGKQPTVFAAWGWTEAQVAVAGLRHIHGAITRDAYESALNGLKHLQTLGGVVGYGPHSHTGIKHMFMVKASTSKLIPVTK